MASIPLTPNADWSSFSAPNAEFEKLLPSLNDFKIVGTNTTVASLRAMGSTLPPSVKWPDVDEKDIKITMRDGFVNRARIYSPLETGSEGRPLLVTVYGGGWVMGKLENEEKNCRSWVRKWGGVAVALEHRLCPEVKFPVPVEDSYDAVKWIATNHESIGADPSKGFVLGGVSSGATTMITTSHLWRDEGLTPRLTGLFLSVPAPCVVEAIPQRYKSQIVSWEQMKDAPVFNRETSAFLHNIVNPDPFSPLRSPLLFPTGHKNLPPAYFVVGGADPWRDVGLLYEKVLREENGVKTKVDVFPGLPHGFWGIFPQSEFTKEYREKSDEGFGWLLEQMK